MQRLTRPCRASAERTIWRGPELPAGIPVTAPNAGFGAAAPSEPGRVPSQRGRAPSCRESVAGRLTTHRPVASTVTRSCQQACPNEPTRPGHGGLLVPTNASRLSRGSPLSRRGRAGPFRPPGRRGRDPRAAGRHCSGSEYMSSIVLNITFDCADPRALARFWGEVTGCVDGAYVRLYRHACRRSRSGQGEACR
jgi:hypothetical protein